MKKNTHRKLLTSAAMSAGILFVFFAFAVPEFPAQFDRVKKAVKKVENELNKEAAKTKTADTNKTGAETETDPNTPTETAPAVKNANQNKRLVFSNQPIDPNNPSNLRTSFQAGEHIYGLLILDKPLAEFVKEGYTRDLAGFDITRPVIEIAVLVDGARGFNPEHNFVFSLDDRENAWKKVPGERYFFFDVAPEPSKQKTYGYKDIFFPKVVARGRKFDRAKAGSQFYSHVLSKLEPGAHTITFKIDGKEAVAGEFQVSGNDYSFYNRLYDELEAAAAANIMMPASKWDDKAVADSVKTAYKSIENEAVLRVVLTNPGWYEQKNALGQILFRGVFAAIATKTPDGKCWFQSEYFKQNYSGGRYGATMQDGRSETRQLMPCENAMK